MYKLIRLILLIVISFYIPTLLQAVVLGDSTNWMPVNGYYENSLRVGAFLKVKLAADSQYLLTYSSDSIFRKWYIKTGIPVYEKKFDFKGNNFLDFTNDEKYFLLYYPYYNDSIIYYLYLFSIQQDTIINKIIFSENIYHGGDGGGQDFNANGILTENNKLFLFNCNYTIVEGPLYTYIGKSFAVDMDSFLCKTFLPFDGYYVFCPSNNDQYFSVNGGYGWNEMHGGYSGSFTSGLFLLDDSLKSIKIYSFTNNGTTDPNQIQFNDINFSLSSDILAALSETEYNSYLSLWSVPDLKQIDSIYLPNYFSSRFCKNEDMIIYYSQGNSSSINIYVRSLKRIVQLYDLDSGTIQPNNLYLLPVSDSSFIGYGTDGVLRLFNVPNEKILSVNDKKTTNTFNIYPNPFTNVLNLNISLLVGEYVKFDIYNCLGQELITGQKQYYDSGNHQINFDFKEESIGVYFYKLQIGTNVYTGSLIHY